MHVQSTLPITIPLLSRSGAVVAQATVDLTDALAILQYTWRLKSVSGGKRYAVRYEWLGGQSRAILLHRQLMGLPIPRDWREVDHINGDGLDNRRANLRVVTHAQNQQNKRADRNSTSPFRGVYWSKQYKRWAAQARLAGRVYWLGRFVTQEEAGAVAAAWRQEHMPYAVDENMTRV